MAPKKRAVKAVVTAKKVVEETVEVVVSPPEGNDKVEVLSSSTREDKNLEILTAPVQKKSQRQKGKEPETAAAQAEDEDETQPSSEPETAPTPRKPTGATEKGRKKITNGDGGEKRRRKRRGGAEGYRRYVYKVMKQVHPDLGISAMAMTIINNLMSDMFEKIADEAARLQKYTGRRTLSSREVQGAVKLVLPGELGKHAVAEGTKAVGNYISYPAAGKTAGK